MFESHSGSLDFGLTKFHAMFWTIWKNNKNLGKVVFFSDALIFITFTSFYYYKTPHVSIVS
jgi:hypothetical protein